MVRFNSGIWLKYGKKDMLTFNIFSYSSKQPVLLLSFKYNDRAFFYLFYSGCWKTELILGMSVNQYAILFSLAELSGLRPPNTSLPYW